MPAAERQHLTGIAFYNDELLICGSVVHCYHVTTVFGPFDRGAALVAGTDCLDIETCSDCCPNERHLGSRSVGIPGRSIAQLDIVAQYPKFEQTSQLAICHGIHDRSGI